MQAERFPEHIAIIHDAQVITFGSLNQKANQLAHYLQSEGVKPDTPIAICMERSIDLLIGMLAILKAGGAYVPLDLAQPKERLLFILEDTKAPLLITKSAFKDKLTGFKGQLILLDKNKTQLKSYSKQNVMSSVTPNHLVYIIYTSGSTGLPKGVLIEHRSLVHYCQWFANYSQCKSQQRVDFSANYIFDMSVSVSILPLALDLTVVICEDEVKKNIVQYLDYLQTNYINLIKITPTYFKELLLEVKKSTIKLPDLHEIVLGGEALRIDDCKEWLSIYPTHQLINEYGPTETTVAVLQYKICKENVDSLGVTPPIGSHSSDYYFYILDSKQKEVPVGEVGELYIGGVCLARGYLNRVDTTKEQFIQNPFINESGARLYKSGDLCRKLLDGSFEYLGRIDNQVKICGFRIELGEIEHCLAKYPAIENVVVLAITGEKRELQLVAYYTPKNSTDSLEFNQMRNYLQHFLPEYMIPTTYIKVSSFPLTANGKLDQSALPTPQSIRDQSYKAPSSKLERILVEIWVKELGILSIGVDDNFFALGGHSLSAVRVILSIQKKLAKELSMNDIYKAPTIAKLASKLKRTKKTRKHSSLSEKQRFSSKFAFKDKIPLSDFQLMVWCSYLFEPKIKKLNVVTRKRIQGQLDMVALNLAFKSLFNKNKILCSWMERLYPAQSIQKKWSFLIEEKDLQSYTVEEYELLLLNSLENLLDFYPWKKNRPMLIARVFKIEKDTYDLQICMPHHVCDEASVAILFSDLSQLYLLHKRHRTPYKFTNNLQFIHYIAKEQALLSKNLEENICHWKSYLNEAALITFPPEHVIKNMKKERCNYSSYLKISEQVLAQLTLFCKENNLTISDTICAALGKALSNCSGHLYDKSKAVLINITKSTREDSMFDETIGCFLAPHLVKLKVSEELTLASLSRQVQQSMIDNYDYQHCPSLIKLSCINSQSNGISLSLMNGLILLLGSIYKAITRFSNNYYESFKYLSKLAGIDRKKSFIINLNIWNNFLEMDKDNEKQLFGSKVENIEMPHYDLSSMDSILDVCLMREESTNQSYVVVSSNLKPQFRELIGHEMLRILNG